MKDIEIFLSPVSILLKGDESTDPRVGHLIRQGVSGIGGARLAIVGFPTDEGVKRNLGRIGAADAPQEIREQLYKLCPDVEHFDLISTLLRESVDLGDILLGETLEESQERLGKVVGALLEAQIIPVIIGGGHETSYGHFLGYVEAGMNLEILNWDAHTDVRPFRDGLAHSGSPFRQALEHRTSLCKRYRVAGAHPGSVSKEHVEYVNQRGQVYFRDRIDENLIAELYYSLDHPAMVTFDIDAVDQAYAPGVSAPAVPGLSPQTWLSAGFTAGKTEIVTSFDIVECNPQYDRDHQTARLAAQTILQFMMGVAGRV
jgi:formiminoglutamase